MEMGDRRKGIVRHPWTRGDDAALIEAVAKRLEIPMEKVFTNIHKYGNTSAASVPLALDEARRTGRVKDGDLVSLVVFGGGLTWGAALVRW